MAENDSLAEFLASAVQAAEEAGEIIRKGFYQTKNVEHKGQEMMAKGIKRSKGFKIPVSDLVEKGSFNQILRPTQECTSISSYAEKQVDLVTKTDKACEELIFNHLRKLYPTHKFIGEKTTAALGATELTDEHTWIVDPLDGTTNFVHGFPFVCVSIGLTIQKVPTVGVVYNPILDELFTAIHGKGALLNGNPIKVSSQTELISSLLATEVGTECDKETIDVCTNRINALLFKARSLRMAGSCAMDLCGVACGRLDASFEIGFGGPWDVAGAAVIVREAGGEVFDPSGKDFDLTSKRVAASNPFLKDAFVEILRQTGC